MQGIIISCDRFRIGISSLIRKIPAKYDGLGKINTISNRRRRLQHATCLSLLDILYPGSAHKLRYYNGCPVVGNNLNVSFTHDDGLCAVATSQHYPVGIDLQKPYPAIGRVRKRFMHPLDSVANAPLLQSLTILWSLKEAGLKILLARGIPKSFSKVVCLNIETIRFPKGLYALGLVNTIWVSSVLVNDDKFYGYTIFIQSLGMYLSVLVKEKPGHPLLGITPALSVWNKFKCEIIQF